MRTCGSALLKMMFVLLAAVLSAIPVMVIPQCQPPNNCSVHVFRVRLSQKPEGEEPVENTTYSAVKNSEYGTNYYEIRGGSEMTPKLAAEIIQSMGKDADPRLKEKISTKQFFWKPVERGNERVISATIPPPPPPKKERTSTPSNSNFKSNEFPVLLVTLLLCVGIFLGILLTAFCLFMADMRKTPQFDRSSAVIYSKVGSEHSQSNSNNSKSNSTEMRPMLSRQDQMERASVAPSVSSAGTRLGPAWRNGNNGVPASASRHISL